MAKTATKSKGTAAPIKAGEAAEIMNPKPISQEALDALDDITNWENDFETNEESSVDEGVKPMTHISSIANDPLPPPPPKQERRKDVSPQLFEQFQSEKALNADENLIGKGEITEVKDTRTIDEILQSRNRIVVLKTIPRNNYRLGLESQPEKFATMPGTFVKWAPDKKGNRYKNGLDKLTPDTIRTLERELGRKLDNEFYAELRYTIDKNKSIGMKLNLDDAYEYVVYLAMSESQLVAANLAQYQNNEGGGKTYAEFYFEDLEAEALQEGEKMAKYDRALDVIKSGSPMYIRNLATALGLAVTNLSDKVVLIQVRKFLEDNPKTKQKNAEMILRFADRGNSYVATHALVIEAINVNVIRRTASKDYAYNETNLGPTLDTVIDYLMEPKASPIRIAIKERLIAQQAGIKQ